MPGPSVVLAIGALRVVGTIGFVVPAAILVSLVVYAVVRDRRLTAREEAEDARQAAMDRGGAAYSPSAS